MAVIASGMAVTGSGMLPLAASKKVYGYDVEVYLYACPLYLHCCASSFVSVRACLRRLDLLKCTDFTWPEQGESAGKEK